MTTSGIAIARADAPAPPSAAAPAPPSTTSEVTRLHDEALVYSRQGRFHLARTLLAKASALDPRHPNTAVTYATELLRSGDFTQPTWAKYNRRGDMAHVVYNTFQTAARTKPDYGTGTALAWLEQGLGEQILFAQLIPHLPDNVAMVACDKRLIPLLERTWSDRQFCPQTDLAAYAIGNFYEYQIPVADLPGRGVPFPPQHTTPYLFADLELAYIRRGAYQRELKHSDQKIIGCTWRTTASKMAEHKTCALKNWAPLFAEDAMFLAIQHSIEDNETDGTPLVADDTLDTARDIEGVASAIWACDGIVTTSNTVAHLASALGRPTLVMAPHGGDKGGLHWAWGLSEHSAFYPATTRVVRCTMEGDWRYPMQEAVKFVRTLQPAWRAL